MESLREAARLLRMAWDDLVRIAGAPEVVHIATLLVAAVCIWVKAKDSFPAARRSVHAPRVAAHDGHVAPRGTGNTPEYVGRDTGGAAATGPNSCNAQVPAGGDTISEWSPPLANRACSRQGAAGFGGREVQDNPPAAPVKAGRPRDVKARAQTYGLRSPPVPWPTIRIRQVAAGKGTERWVPSGPSGRYRKQRQHEAWATGEPAGSQQPCSHTATTTGVGAGGCGASSSPTAVAAATGDAIMGHEAGWLHVPGHEPLVRQLGEGQQQQQDAASRTGVSGPSGVEELATATACEADGIGGGLQAGGVRPVQEPQVLPCTPAHSRLPSLPPELPSPEAFAEAHGTWVYVELLPAGRQQPAAAREPKPDLSASPLVEPPPTASPESDPEASPSFFTYPRALWAGPPGADPPPTASPESGLEASPSFFAFPSARWEGPPIAPPVFDGEAPRRSLSPVSSG
ncbi:hypothetical protein PLESTB_000357600 [Pleodorina starrii]|uniref:Uncharacterized protein n=1 Tax=Pleodorina starrii TaxID=330485 RepID=A0A9W6BDP4_9CHLO|nr:hypothetical protein PLESTM_000037900 [Pleodorina starrii]GLC50237.1 hypothetical protein PLESTB_000357600 [Pleodorina starrii]